jgi:hypothetical protein
VLVNIVFTGLLFGVGLLAGYWIAQITGADQLASDPVGLPTVLFSLIGGIFAVILLHELGHVLGGRLVGFRFRLLIVGPLKVDRLGDRLRIGFNRSIALAGGVAASSPDDDQNLRQRMIAYVAGGPLTSLVTGLLFLLIGQFTTGALAFAASLAGFMSLGIAVVTLMPMRSGGFASDGARLLMLVRGTPEAERWCAISSLANALFSQRAGDLPASLVERALANPDTNSADYLAGVFIAYSWALDRGDLVAAEQHLNTMITHLENFNSAMRPSVLIEAAYFTAAHHHDAAQAREWLSRARGGIVEPFTRARAEAAVLLAEGRFAEAHTQASAGLQHLQRSHPGASGAADRDLLEALLRAAHDQTPHSTN